jgi:hypothetical protein
LSAVSRPWVAQPAQPRESLIVGLGLAVLLILLFWPLIQAVVPQTLDYPWHIRAAQDIAEKGLYRLPHPAYQWLVILVRTFVPGGDFTTAGIAASVLSAVALGEILYVLFLNLLTALPALKRALLAALLALALSIVTPITLFRPDNGFYWGYIFITVYHNPTYLLLRPLAVLLTLAAVWSFRQRLTAFRLVALILLTIFATLAKPNYTLCLLPALALVAAYRVWKRQRIVWALLATCLLVGGGTLMIQYLLTFTAGGLRSSQMAFVPLYHFISHPSPVWLLPKLVLSILFPLCVYLFYFRQARRDLRLNLAWLSFIIGAAYAYLLEEITRGRVAGSGNWLWGAGISLFILFVCSTLFFVQQNVNLIAFRHPRHYPRAFWWALLALCLHVVSGVVWFSLYAAAGAVPWGQYW